MRTEHFDYEVLFQYSVYSTVELKSTKFVRIVSALFWLFVNMMSVQIWRAVNYCIVHIIFTCLLLNTVAVNGDNFPYTEIATESGKVRGKLNTTIFAGQPFYSYLGIPYAEKPINDLRFKVNTMF